MCIAAKRRKDLPTLYQDSFLTEKGRPQERPSLKISLVSCAMGAGNGSIGQVCYYSDFRLAVGPWVPVVRVLSTIVATGEHCTDLYLVQRPTTFRRASCMVGSNYNTNIIHIDHQFSWQQVPPPHNVASDHTYQPSSS